MGRIAAAVLAGGVALGLGPAARAADPIVGLWQTTEGQEGGHLHVRIAPCGAAFCGTIVTAVDAAGAVGHDYPHLGKRMLWDMRPEGEGRYAGGRIWAPDEDRTYRLILALRPEGLAVRGCVLAFCRDAGVWTRLD